MGLCTNIRCRLLLGLVSKASGGVNGLKVGVRVGNIGLYGPPKNFYAGICSPLSKRGRLVYDAADSSYGGYLKGRNIALYYQVRVFSRVKLQYNFPGVKRVLGYQGY